MSLSLESGSAPRTRASPIVLTSLYSGGISGASHVENDAGADFELFAVIEDEGCDMRPAREGGRDHRRELRVRRRLINARRREKRVGEVRCGGAVGRPQREDRISCLNAHVDTGLRVCVVRSGLRRLPDKPLRWRRLQPASAPSWVAGPTVREASAAPPPQPPHQVTHESPLTPSRCSVRSADRWH
jgi:hypothetical protein